MNKISKTRNIMINNLTYSKLKKQFILFKKAQGLAERTMKDYDKTFEVFERYYTKEIIDIEEMQDALLEMFSKWSTSAPATFNVPFSNLQCFFNWAVDSEYLEKNPLALTGLKKKKDMGKARNIPEDIINRLFNIIDINSYVGFRDYVIFVLMLDVGIRPAEAFGVEITDIDLEHFEITIRRIVAKTRVARILPLSYQTVEILRRFLMIRENNWSNYLFLTINGEKMTTNAWEYRIKYYREKLGYKFTAYDFRHSFSLFFLKNGRRCFCLATNFRTYKFNNDKKICKFSKK